MIESKYFHVHTAQLSELYNLFYCRLSTMCFSCTDVNAAAAGLSVKTGQQNEALLNALLCDLVRL